MGERSVMLRSFALCLLALFIWIPDHAFSKNNVGCFFSSTICELEEECYDDNAFGRCQLSFELDDDPYRHQLGSETIQLLEREMTRLFAGGYRWKHDYTQCVVQNILYTNRHEISYDPGLCSRIMQFTLPEVPPDLLLELESPDPDELAFIKFKPNRDEPGNAMYADEIFTPPLFSEKETDTQKRSQLMETPEGHWQKNFRSVSNENDVESSALASKETIIQELAKAAEDTKKLLEGIGDTADRYPDENLPIRKVELSSDLNQLPAFTEGGTQWLPVDEDSEDLLIGDLIEPYDKKRVKIIHHDEHPQKETPPGPTLNNVITLPVQPEEQREVEEEPRVEEDEPPTFGKSVGDEEESGFRWNAKHRNRYMDDDLTRFAKGQSPRSRTQMIEPEPSDSNNLSDVIENDYLEDQLYAILPGNKDLPTFTSDKRYDIKKPGPTYMIHDDEDGENSLEDEKMAMQNADRYMQALSRNSWGNPLNYLLDSPVDGKLRQPAIQRFEATDEIRRIYVTGGNDDTQGIEETKGANDKIEKQKSKALERLTVDMPEVIEGVDETLGDEEKTANAAKTGEGHIGHFDSVDATRTNLLVKEKDIDEEKAQDLVKTLERHLNLGRGSFSDIKVKNQFVTFKVNPNSERYNASEVATKAVELSTDLKSKTGLTVEEATIGDKIHYEPIKPGHDRRLVILTFALCGAVAGILLAAVTAYFVRRHTRYRDKLHSIAQPDTEASLDYQDLCRQRMASKANEKPEPVHAVHSPKKMRSLSQEGQASNSSHSSTSSWNEEPVTSNMDISTGHMILSYMEDHLKNKDKLEKEWEALCSYEAELCTITSATIPPNIKKNRYTDILPYDHSRVVLNEATNVSGSDYINASSITDHDPRNPAYIATQGPLPQTAADFWQMIWEQGSVVIVMLSRLMENGVAMCHRYWPEEGSEVYHIYEVHLVSEHIWCDDYLVRSFYLKNLRTSETRTVTQFHFMSWPDNGVPNSTKALLEFRRKVNKSYRGRSCPIVVHCSDGIGRTGTYSLIDMVLNRMAKGAKEIDIAATLEHVRDQRAGMVKTKAQFEFVLMAIAEEVHAILKALSQ